MKTSATSTCIKILLYTLFLTGALFLLSSCFEKNNKGYPEAVRVSHKGGTYMIPGNAHFYHMSIEHGEETVVYGLISDEQDSTVMSYQWLTVIAKFGVNKIKIIVEPSDIKQKRKLRIIGYYGPEYAEINVIQNGN